MNEFPKNLETFVLNHVTSIGYGANRYTILLMFCGFLQISLQEQLTSKHPPISVMHFT